MSALRTNEVIKKATLTVRKAGGPTPSNTSRSRIEKARITSLDSRSGDGGDPTVLVEELSIAFSKIGVEYKPQGADGQSAAAPRSRRTSSKDEC